MSKMVKVAKANQEGDFHIDIEEIQGWKIKSKTTMGGVVYITTEDGTYSMSRIDHDNIFQKNGQGN